MIGAGKVPVVWSGTLAYRFLIKAGRNVKVRFVNDRIDIMFDIERRDKLMPLTGSGVPMPQVLLVFVANMC